MQGQRSNGEAYYRCRYALEYALANKISHPSNVYLRERDVLAPLDDALAGAFAPTRLQDTITRMAASQLPANPDYTAVRTARARLADFDTKLAGYRAALDAGADPPWSPDGSPRSKTSGARSKNSSPRVAQRRPPP
jgi:hypothetical protein